MDRELSSRERWQIGLRRSFPWIIGGILLLVLLAGAATLLSPSVDLSNVTVATVDRGVVRETIEASGRVVPAFEIVLSSPVEARVQRVLRTTGETIEAGATILQLDVSQPRLEMERIEERIGQKRNERVQLQTSMAQSKLESESRIEQKELDVEILGYKAEQNRKLRAEGLIAEEELRRSEVEAKKARIEHEQLKRAAESSEQTSLAKLAGIDLEISILEKERSQAQRQLDLAAMKAPRGGVLTWVVPQEGATVSRGEVLARIADVSRFRIEGTVSDIHASRLAAGMDVIISTGQRRERGMIASVDPTVRNGAVTFQVEPPAGGTLDLRNNLRVDLHLVTAEREGVVRLRRGAGIREESRQELFVVSGDRAVKRPVQVGLTGYEAVEITEGLDEGNRVIISAMDDFRHADEIRLKGEER